MTVTSELPTKCSRCYWPMVPEPMGLMADCQNPQCGEVQGRYYRDLVGGFSAGGGGLPAPDKPGSPGCQCGPIAVGWTAARECPMHGASGTWRSFGQPHRPASWPTCLTCGGQHAIGEGQVCAMLAGVRSFRAELKTTEPWDVSDPKPLVLRFVDDDRQGFTLQILRSHGDGDFHVSVVPDGDRWINASVRVCSKIGGGKHYELYAALNRLFIEAMER